MSQEKPNQKAHISIRLDDAKRYIPDDVPYNKTGEFVMKALAYYSRHLERERDDWER